MATLDIYIRLNKKKIMDFPFFIFIHHASLAISKYGQLRIPSHISISHHWPQMSSHILNILILADTAHIIEGIIMLVNTYISSRANWYGIILVE